jgi:hypothetical protein
MCSASMSESACLIILTSVLPVVFCLVEIAPDLRPSSFSDGPGSVFQQDGRILFQDTPDLDSNRPTFSQCELSKEELICTCTDASEVQCTKCVPSANSLHC